MTIKLSSLKADIERERNGDWISSPDIPGARFLVVSLHLPAFRTALHLLEQGWARKYKLEPVPDDISIVGIGRLLHEHILHDWDGFDVPYSKEVAADMLCVPEGRNFIAAVQNAAAMISLAEIEYLGDAVKNSEAPSAKSSV